MRAPACLCRADASLCLSAEDSGTEQSTTLLTANPKPPNFKPLSFLSQDKFLDPKHKNKEPQNTTQHTAAGSGELLSRVAILQGTSTLGAVVGSDGNGGGGGGLKVDVVQRITGRSLVMIWVVVKVMIPFGVP